MLDDVSASAPTPIPPSSSALSEGNSLATIPSTSTTTTATPAASQRSRDPTPPASLAVAPATATETPPLPPPAQQITETYLSLANGNKYYLHQPSSPAPTLPASCLAALLAHSTKPCAGDEYILATLIPWPAENKPFTEKDIARIADEVEEEGWESGFLGVIILLTPSYSPTSTSASTTTTTLTLTVAQITHIVLPVSVPPTETGLATMRGPCAIHRPSGLLSPAWRVFEDTACAFIGGGIVPDTEGEGGPFRYRQLVSGGIAVPSRVGVEVSEDRPLAGLRFATKDLLPVASLPTTCGNRAYTTTYPPAPTTAPALQRLLTAGAILLGKLKTSQFAEGQAPSEWVDFKAPWNPRGDGYQSPSSSSSGSAVAVAAYPWVDFAVGTDTGGSIRHPGGLTGTYGIRPSLHAVPTAGVYPVTPLMDTVGFFARSAAIAARVGRVLLGPAFTPPPPRRRYKLLYPVRPRGTGASGPLRWFPFPGEQGVAWEAEGVMERVVRGLEGYLGCERSVFNLDELWSRTRPEGMPEGLDDAVGTLYSIITTRTPTSAPDGPIYKFLNDYAARNGGRKPFIDPVVTARFEYGRRRSEEEVLGAVRSFEVFRGWIESVLFKTEEGEVPVLIFPQSFGRPDYRTAHPPPTLFWSTFSIYSLSYISGCPDYTVPVGEVPYHSSVTAQEEYLPVALSVLMRKGGDAELFGILEGLEREGVLRPVEVGRRLYGES